MVGKKYRVLLIYPGSTPPRSHRERNMEWHISKYCAGDLVTTHWGKRSDLPPKPLRRIYDLGSFGYHATFCGEMPRLLKFFWTLIFFVHKGLSLSFSEGRYDAVISYGPYTCCMAAWVVRLFTRSKLVIMLPAPPVVTFKQVPGPLGRLKHAVAARVAPALIRSADGVWMLHPGQLDQVPGIGSKPTFTFPDFVPVRVIAGASRPTYPADDRYVLFIGHPFPRKGVDVLIQAFSRISERHPDVRLEIVGHCPDLSPYIALAADNPRIHFRRAVFHDEVLSLMDRCALFVHPSRMEGVPRIVMEAMACRKPVIASRVDGTPTILRDEVDGLLVDSEDVEGLASKMDRLLSDPEQAARLAEGGHRRMMADFSESSFAIHFRDMVASLARPGAFCGKPVRAAAVN